MDGIGGLAENRQGTADGLIQHGNDSQGLGILQDILDPVAVIVDILAGQVGAQDSVFRRRRVHIGQTSLAGAELVGEFRLGAFHLGKPVAFDRTGHGIVSEGVRRHPDLVTLFQQQGGNPLVPVEKIDEFGLAFFHVHFIRITAVGVGLDRIKGLVAVDIQQSHDDFGVGGVRYNTFDTGLAGASGKQHCRKQGGKSDSTISHILRG